jgi:hypothetical protein
MQRKVEQGSSSNACPFGYAQAMPDVFTTLG